MLQQAFSFLFSILPFVFSLSSVSTADSNVYVQCSEFNPTSITPYESNVNSLFTSIVDSASIYNFNKFETSPQSDGAYGLFQCRGDLSASLCKDCFVSAASQLKTACPTSTGGEIQLEGCFVKYDNTSFFGARDEVEVYRRCGPSIGYNSDVLSRIDAALRYLVGGNGEYFREGDFGSIQGVAQCVQDLSLSDCQDCLSEACRRLKLECETSSWGDIYLGKCYIRYVDEEGDEDIANDGDNDTDNDRRRRNRSRRNKSNIGKTKAKWIGYIVASAAGTATVTVAVKYVFKPYAFGGGLEDDLKNIKIDLNAIVQKNTAKTDNVDDSGNKTKDIPTWSPPWFPTEGPITTPTTYPCSSCSNSNPNSCHIL